MLSSGLIDRQCSNESGLLVRRGIRTLAQRTGLRPERSALDHSAILTDRNHLIDRDYSITNIELITSLKTYKTSALPLS
jgi:hypothetical protein